MNNELVVVKDGKVMCTSTMVAEKFDREHKNVLQAAQNLECSPEFAKLNYQPSSYINSQNKRIPMIEMTRDGFTFLVMGFTGAKAAEWKEKYINAFNAMEDAIRKTGGYKIDSTASAAEAMPRIASILEANKKIAEILGLDTNHQIIKANQLTRQQTGFDCMQAFDVPALEYKPNIQYHTPSILGDMSGISAVKMNRILEEKGLQKETRDRKDKLVWVVTEKGKEFSRMFDTGKLHSNGSPIQQVKWSEKVLEV